ncbi:hypothetical protein RGQ29_018975 [Quercus rubra]|uniref:ATP synthase subunit epsilon, mitochondrial n=1 Tax=Quercus rubra TaxID=3512 RepID=A0AAN7ISF9_QUERU|nr:hypothetical protein RGQ29_018975 [Quercus rubra]
MKLQLLSSLMEGELKKSSSKRVPSLAYIYSLCFHQKDILASTSAAVPFWRSAGITYVAYSNVCANLLRNCLKEPHKSEALTREKVHFSRSKRTNGKPQKPALRSYTPED